jgi:segregation and condensation protein B
VTIQPNATENREDLTADRRVDEPADKENGGAERRGQDLRLLEALIFAASEPLDEAGLAARLAPEGDVDLGLIKSLLGELSELYSNRGVNLTRVAGGWAFRTAADLAPRLMLERVVARKLSRAAIETLAIVAYHQPVTRGEIEEIRGVALSRGILDTLMEAGWVRPKGHRASPGRPATWITTPEFLVQFGLDSIADLPGVDELKAAGLLDARSTTQLGEMSEDARAIGEAEEEPREEEGADAEMFPKAEEE